MDDYRKVYFKTVGAKNKDGYVLKDKLGKKKYAKNKEQLLNVHFISQVLIPIFQHLECQWKNALSMTSLRMK